ncbi:MAG: response regulator [Saprospiraceae bacterium]|nr:response regulator [Saprospiraceae bacterium]
MKYFITLIYLSVSFHLFSQDTDINYVIDFITTKQGLSHNYVSSIISDDLNIKWIGTENGITKYNGYDFEYLKPGKENNGLLNENIEILFKDKDNNLWIGTKSGGVSYLDIKKNTIENFNRLIDLENEGDLRVTAIAQDDKGNIWIGVWGKGVFVIDFKKNKLIKKIKASTPIYSIKKDFKGNIWFAAHRTLIKYITTEDDTQEYVLDNFITDILPDPYRNKIWISTSGLNNTKLFEYDYSKNTIESIETHIISEFSKKLFLDNSHRLWVGTWGSGVYRSNDDLSRFDKIKLVSSSSTTISANYNTILNIHQDKNNIIWLATANGGLVRLIEGNGFKNGDRLIVNPELQGHLNIIALHRSDNYLFVGTVFSGLYYGKDFSRLKQFREIGNIRIKSLYEYNKQLFIGTNDGFYIFDLNSQKIITASSILKKITSFHVDNDMNLYIGTQEQGLAIVKLNEVENANSYNFYNEESNIDQKIESNRITGIQEDDKNNIWVSSYNGLHLFNKNKKIFIHQSKLLKEKLPTVIINSISLKGNSIWLATPGGLFKLKYNDNKLSLEDSVTKENGLNSDFICSITFDRNAKIWLSTHTEIVSYDENKRITTSYGDLNGVKTASFNNASFCNFENDEIYFGGIDNITYFSPDKISNINTVPEIIFTNLRVNNKLIEYEKGSKILDKNINYANEIKLTHHDNFFSTSFAANDFLGKLNIKYRYRLEGYNDSWIDLQNRNEINFAGLAPGHYTLKIEASRDNQNWSNPKSINITMMTSPWKSPIAYFAYAMTFLLIVTYFVRSNNIKLKLQNNLEIARIDKEKEIELSEAKLNFFTNISHEFRTPLTLIIGPLKELLQNEKLTPKAFENLTFIDRNTDRLLNLINQLLEFRKADYGLLKLDVSFGNFVRFSSEIFLYFREAANSKNIKYRFIPSKHEIIFPFDRDKMEIVLCNLLSNALKYSKSGDTIEMNVDSDGEFCVISIKDTGIGMNSEYLGQIFDRFFQIKTGNTARMVGSGIGLSFSKQIVELHYGNISVNSEKNVGTEFVVKLSTNAAIYGDDINDTYLKTDNINAYNIRDFETPIKNLNINEKEYSVLIIDDNPDILSYIKDILKDYYKVMIAENGDIGYEIASKEIPDLIISDIMMPGKDGISLCKELKTQITTSHIPIILLTARTSTVFEIEGLKTGADDYITKPFNANVIMARIASLLENRVKLRAHLLNRIRFEPLNDDIIDDDSENAFINKAILLVEKNIDNVDFGIDNLVSELYMSQSTLFRKIKSLTGLSLTAFIRSIRLKKAANLILSSDLNLNQVAYEVGFNDYKYFKTSFKKQFNCLPSKYKEIMINK